MPQPRKLPTSEEVVERAKRGVLGHELLSGSLIFELSDEELLAGAPPDILDRVAPKPPARPKAPRRKLRRRIA